MRNYKLCIIATYVQKRLGNTKLIVAWLGRACYTQVLVAAISVGWISPGGYQYIVTPQHNAYINHSWLISGNDIH